MKSLTSYINNKFTVAGTTSEKILLFDIDDTILKSKACVWVIKDGKRVKKLTSSEFNEYKPNTNETFDFSEFNSPKILDKSVFLPYWETLKREYKSGTHIGIITARSNSELFHDFFKRHGVDIKKELIFAINEDGRGFSGTISERKSQAIEKIVNWGYKTLVFFDDNKDNLDAAKKMASKFNIKIHTVQA